MHMEWDTAAYNDLAAVSIADRYSTDRAENRQTRIVEFEIAVEIVIDTVVDIVVDTVADIVVGNMLVVVAVTAVLANSLACILVMRFQKRVSTAAVLSSSATLTVSLPMPTEVAVLDLAALWLRSSSIAI